MREPKKNQASSAQKNRHRTGMRRCIDHNRKTQAWLEAKRKSSHQERKPESAIATTCVAMFLPSEERWSTAALAPIASLPSILVSRVNEKLELSWAPGSCCGFANRGDPSGYRANFRCRSFLLRTDETSRAVSSTWIGAQADSQSARKNARGPENLKNEQHKWR